jgi:hypothetical protein
MPGRNAHLSMSLHVLVQVQALNHERDILVSTCRIRMEERDRAKEQLSEELSLLDDIELQVVRCLYICSDDVKRTFLWSLCVRP